MRRLMVVTIEGVTLALVGLIALDTARAVAHDHVIKESIALMRKGLLGYFKAIMAFVKDGKGAMADVEKVAKGVQAAAANVPALLPKRAGRPDADEKKTRSLAKIWVEWATLEDASRLLVIGLRTNVIR